MPILIFNTNVPSSKITPGLEKSISETIAKILSKPIERVMLIVRPGENILYGGSNAPCGHCALHSIGQLTPEQNASHAAALGDFFESNLGIPKDRLAIRFNDMKPSDVGFDGATRG